MTRMRRKSMPRRRPLLAAVLLFACAACAGSGDAAKGKPAAVKPPAVTTGPRVGLPSGAVFSVEIARTDQEKAQGLMFRESLARNASMIFLFEGLEIRPFWMKNCHFPLDIVYLRGDRIVDVLLNVPPCPGDPCPTFPPRQEADTVLEVNAGIAKEHGLAAGARLVYQDIPGRGPTP